MKKFFASCFLALVLLLYPKIAFSASNFATSYDATYTINDDGITHVVLKGSLKNTTSNSYATSYKINTGFHSINNVKSLDTSGSIIPGVTQIGDEYSITLAFSAKVVGIGKQIEFTVSFDTKDIAQKLGNVWEINIPKMAKQNEFENLRVHVLVPSSFGSPLYVKPETDGKTLDFTKKQLGNAGISLAFGEEQYYKFTLHYHLKNTHIFPIQTEIALPPSTNYQDVAIENIEPKPQNIQEDNDGNWLATYTLSPSKKIDVVVLGRVRMHIYPKQEALSDEQAGTYIIQKPYWEQNDKIKELAKKLKTPRAIYTYVVNNLTYDFSRITASSNRLGAGAVLQNPSSAVCLEFTDLFIALARASGIPAREVDGFAYTQNEKQRPLSLLKDVLHAWPEYYDKENQTWAMVDPTWENTTGGIDYFYTLDFNHVVLAIKGQNSTYPLPAGDYKLVGSKTTQDVDIAFADTYIDTTPKVSSKLFFADSLVSGFPVEGFLELANNEKVAFPPQDITVTSNELYPKTQKLTFRTIPPFGTIKIPVTFARTPFLTNANATVTIQINQNTLVKTIRIRPIFSSKMGMIGGVFLAIFTIFLFIITKRTWGVFVSKQK